MKVCLWNKPSARITSFEYLNEESAMLYHLVYHYSIAIHLNHLIFLNAYVFGVLGLCTSAGGWISMCILAGIFSIYVLCLCKVSFGSLYILVIWILVFLANKVSNSIPVWGFVMIVFGSIAMQLLGHWLFEDFQAPPDIVHGLIAAPVLEFSGFFYRLQPNLPIWIHVEKARILDSLEISNSEESD
jgi:uncharacterized membrane protein YGL010W